MPPPPRQKVRKVFEKLGLGLYFGWWLVIFAGVERLTGRRVVDFEVSAWSSPVDQWPMFSF